MNFKFPKDFLFGCASSAYQIEAGAKEGGKGESVSDHYHTLYPEKYCGGDPAFAADFYHRYREDIKDMKEMGLKSFRFSIAWTRIFPNGPTEVCQAGLDYYDDLINALLEADIVPLFDLFHSDLPYWVIEMGGILCPEFVDWFGDYARVCFEHFGDRIPYWSTINEPSINVMASYAYGTNAPFLKDMDLAIKACHNALLAHYRAVKIYKEMGFTGKIGAVIHVQPTYSLSFDPKDIHAMDHDFAFYAGWWLDAMIKGHYPEVLADNTYYMGKLPENYQEDLKKYFVPVDFIGVNFYNPSHARFSETDPRGYETFRNESYPTDDYGFANYPQGLFDVAMHFKNTYPDLPIFITENGISKKKWGNLEEERRDDYRIRYMREHLREVSRAIQAGANIQGYYHWTLMDTTEGYAGGYKFIFGLVQVDFETKERYRRDSWYYYQKVIANCMVD